MERYLIDLLDLSNEIKSKIAARNILFNIILSSKKSEKKFRNV